MTRQQVSNGDLDEMKFPVPQCNHLLLQPSVTGVWEIGPAVNSPRLRAAEHRLAHAIRQQDCALHTQNFLHFAIVVPAEREGFLSELGKQFARLLKSRTITNGIDIRLVENGIDRLEEILSAGDLDFAASTIPVAEGLEWQSVRCEPLMVLLPAREFAARKKSIDLTELKQMPFILFDSSFAITRLVVVACRRAGFEPTVATRSSQLDFIMELVAAGVGIAFVPKMVAEQRHRPGLRSLLVNPKIDWHVGMTWRRGAYLSHAAKAWLMLVRERHGCVYRKPPL